MNILITGGAGYIGSHVLKALLENSKDNVVVLDNFSTGNKQTLEVLKNLGKFEVLEGDLKDEARLEEIFSTHDFEAIIHFAASIEVFESTQKPLKYYLNNTANTANLIDKALKFGISKFIFSSTAATYGEPSCGIVDEQSPQLPINPYGRSKLMSEWILKDAALANPKFKFGILRYFNVAGASNDGLIGQNYPNATHLVKVVCEAIFQKRKYVGIFGTDYDTDDGTCVRDYIHIEDLANAHLNVLEYLNNHDSDIFNVGYGRGFSVLELIKTAKKISGVDFEVRNMARRAGDPAILISNANKLKSLTKWKEKTGSLESIIQTAMNWEKKLTKHIF